MGLFSRNKKNGMFDKNIEPKCAYCENGKPARSKGKILCPRCGIVESDYSCKKFKYSPFLRIPERGQEAAEKSAEAAAEPENTADVSELVQQSAEPVEEIKEISEAEAQSASETVSENVPSVTPENSAEELTDETQTADVSEPEDEKTETPFPAYISIDKDEAEPEPEPEKPDESKAKSLIYAKGEGKTDFVKAEVSETESQQGSFSNINNKPSDNSENIAKLESVPKPSVSSIDNYIQPIEINLPKMSESAVSSIENKPQKRNAEEYLKTISVGNVSEIENNADNVHNISSDFKTGSKEEN